MMYWHSLMLWQSVLTCNSYTGYVLQISVIQFFLVKKNISDIHNIILPRTNDVTFAIHVYWAFNFRYPQLHSGYLEWTFWISATEFLLGKTPITDIFNPVVTSHNFHIRYPKWKIIPDIQNAFWVVIMSIRIMTSKNAIVDMCVYIVDVHMTFLLLWTPL